MLMCQAVLALKEGKLRRPIEKTHCEKSSRSASAAPPTQRSGGTDSEAFTSFNDTSTPSEKASNRSHLTRTEHSSSERDLSLVLRREAQQILERNKNFLDPAMATWDSNSSKSPNTSGSRDLIKAEHSFYDDGNGGYYFSNGCYYPIPIVSMYPPPCFQTNPTAILRPPAHQKYKKNVPSPAPTLNQQSKPFVPKREEIKKLDPAAPAFDQKRKNSHIKEEKKEPVKPKPARRPLGNAAGNAANGVPGTAACKTIRQIINRNKLTIKIKSRDQIEKRELSDPRRARSKDNPNNAADQDDNDIQSDVYAPGEMMTKKKETKKQRFHAKKFRKPTPGVLAINGTKRTEPGSIVCRKTVMRDHSLEAREKICVTNMGKEWKREINGFNLRDTKKTTRQQFVQRTRRREFEEDRAVQGRKLSFDMTKRVVRHPTPDHKASIESEFS